MTEADKKKLEFLKVKNIGKNHLGDYLEELRGITVGVADIENRLLKLEDSHLLMQKYRGVSKTPCLSYEFPFAEKGRLCKIFDSLTLLRNGEVVVWSYYSDYCGVLRLNDISEFNCNFEFTAEHVGLISVFLKDFSNGITLDFYTEDGRQMIEVEIYGHEWTRGNLS